MRQLITIVLVLFICCCSHVNKEELILKDYVVHDLDLTQLRIDNQLKYLKQYAREQPNKYQRIFELSDSLNQLSLELEKQLLSIDDLDVINSLVTDFKSNTTSVFVNFSRDQTQTLLDFEINLVEDKYQFLRNLKELNYLTSHDLIESILYSWTGSPSISKPSFKLERINKNQLALNIYSDAVKLFPNDFDRKSFYINTVTDLNNNSINIEKSNQDIINRIILNSTSDTIRLNAVIKSNRENKFVLATHDSQLIVDQEKPFDQNLLRDYIDTINKL